MHDFEGEQTYSEKPGHKFALNATFDEISPQDYDGLLIPGGRAPEYIRIDENVQKVVRDFVEAEKSIAAICHGPLVLAAAGGLEGKKCTGYPAIRPDITSAGGKWVDLEIGQAYRDGNLVTAPAWPAHHRWPAEFISLLGTKIEV